MTRIDDNRAAILKVLGQHQAAMVAGNIQTLNDVLDEHFTATHITGYKQPKAEWLAQINSGYFKYHSVQPQGTTVSINGTTATAVRRALIDVTISGSRGTWRLESTTQLVNRSGTWKIMTSRSTTY
ncbi:nuclear transport factor 2 family protein [Deinococcus ruber]|nr:nuclear transport factor 2 family protein [Deinococcus ruber]